MLIAHALQMISEFIFLTHQEAKYGDDRWNGVDGDSSIITCEK